MDEPGILSTTTKNQLTALLKSHENQFNNQIVIAIFNSLDGEDLVDWTNQLFKKWKIGQKGKDNGALLALYWKDRKARIEVGYGLESILTDARSKRILSQSLIPYLKQNRPNEAILSAVHEIHQTIQDPLAADKHGKKKSNSVPLWIIVWVFVFPLMIFISLVRAAMKDTHISRTSSSYRRSTWFDQWGGGSGGGGGSWGGGFGGGGGGGFSGGGGSSGGGGASGGW